MNIFLDPETRGMQATALLFPCIFGGKPRPTILEWNFSFGLVELDGKGVGGLSSATISPAPLSEFSGSTFGWSLADSW